MLSTGLRHARLRRRTAHWAGVMRIITTPEGYELWLGPHLLSVHTSLLSAREAMHAEHPPTYEVLSTSPDGSYFVPRT